MKFIHIGDCHLGKRPGGLRQREEDIERAVAHVVDFAIEKKVDAFVWPGDVFDGVKPTAKTVATLSRLVGSLEVNGIVSYGVDGNHDSVGGQWLQVVGITPLDNEGAECSGVVFRGYHNRSPSRLVSLLEESPPGKADVLILHQAIAEMANFDGVELDLAFLADLAKKTEAKYVALGDIHQYCLEQDEQTTYCYPGSVEVMASNEPKTKYFVEVELEDGQVTATRHTIPTRPYVEKTVTTEDELMELVEQANREPEGFYAVMVGTNLDNGMNRCKALLKEAEVLFRVDPLMDGLTGEQVAWERKSTIVDVKQAIDDSFPEGSDENRLIKQILALPEKGGLEELVAQYVAENTGKDNERNAGQNSAGAELPQPG